MTTPTNGIVGDGIRAERTRIAEACEKIAKEYVVNSDCYRVAMQCAQAARKAP